VHFAAAQGFDSVVRLLAERGADLNVRNKRGLTPLGALLGRSGPARSARQPTMELLRALGARE
jgi:ankyrin repeat protein